MPATTPASSPTAPTTTPPSPTTTAPATAVPGTHNLTEDPAGVVKILVALGGLLLLVSGLSVLWKLLFWKEVPVFSFRQHWGGFGGGSTGWDASTGLMKFTGGSILVLLGVVTLMMVLSAVSSS